MKSFSISRTILRGVGLGVPLAIIFYVLFRIVGAIEKVVEPVAKKLSVAHIFGEITLTVLDIVVLLLICFLLGLLVRLKAVEKFRLYIQEKILYFIPSLHHLKMLADDKLQTDKTEDQWKTVLIHQYDLYWPAYIVEEKDDWIAYVRIEIPTTKPGKFFIAKKDEVDYIEITMTQMRHLNRHFGKGYIDILRGSAANKPQ
jgi:uncharacterized membrane protein